MIFFKFMLSAERDKNETLSTVLQCGLDDIIENTADAGHCGESKEDRRVRKLTLNECWRIMGLPTEYKKISAAGEQYKQLGNSV